MPSRKVKVHRTRQNLGANVRIVGCTSPTVLRSLEPDPNAESQKVVYEYAVIQDFALHTGQTELLPSVSLSIRPSRPRP